MAPERADPAALLDRVPDLSERLRNADDATKRALFDAFDLRVVYDKMGDRLSISATPTEAVAAMLHTGLALGSMVRHFDSGGGIRTHNLDLNRILRCHCATPDRASQESLGSWCILRHISVIVSG